MLTPEQEFGVTYGNYIGSFAVFSATVITLLVYFFISRLLRQRLPTLQVLWRTMDVIAGIGLPLVPLWFLFRTEKMLSDLYQVSGLANNPSGYGALTITTILFAITMLFTKRFILGIELLIVIGLSLIGFLILAFGTY